MAVMHKYIGNLKIPVDDIFFCQVIKTVKDIFDDRLGSVLIEVTIFSEERLQITFVAKLSDNVTITIAGKYLKAPQNIWVAQLFKYIDFREKKFLKLFTFERFELNNFDGYYFV